MVSPMAPILHLLITSIIAIITIIIITMFLVPIFRAC